jgi:hypothetical protein
LEHEGQTLVAEDRKIEAMFHFFDDSMIIALVRSHAINLEHLDLPHLDPSRLCNWFNEVKVLQVIRALPSNKAPDLDGFTTPFM